MEGNEKEEKNNNEKVDHEQKEINDENDKNNKKEETEENKDINQDNKKVENSSNSNIIDLSASCQIINDELTQYDMSFKLIVIGDSFVGKSCITTNATKNIFENYYSATVGFEFFTILYRINSQNIRLQIWDTCGQEEYRSLIQNFYRNSSLAILVYSIDNKNSFENLEIWLNEIRTKGNPDVKIFLVGNKIDLEDKREVSTEEGKLFYENNKLSLFIETSAKNGTNIQELFKKAAILLYREHASYTNMANKLDKSVKLPVVSDENFNVWEKDEEENSRKKKCCK